MTKRLFLIIGIVFFTNTLFASTPPKIFNFRVESFEPNRVYFDSDKPIQGSSAEGFFISYRTISGITINAGSTSNHYIEVSESFSYWDNNTIRYEGGGNIKDDDNNFLKEFTLSYIVNNIPEPSTTKDRYVTTSASGGGDGTSESSAWTLTEAFSKASAGMTVWIKAGNYGNKNLTFSNDGTANSPIKFVGYKNTIGDITSNYYDYGVSWDSSQMPTLTGNDLDSGRAMTLNDIHYVFFENIQITNYAKGLYSYTKNSHVVLRRLNGLNFGSETDTPESENASFIGFNNITYGSPPSDRFQWRHEGNTNFKLFDIVAINSSMSGVTVAGEGGALIDGVKTYNDRVGHNERQDYATYYNGNNNIIRNGYSENFNSTKTNQATHGIGIRGSWNLENNYNLIELCTAINFQEGIYLRNYGCNYNVIKDCVIGNNNGPNHHLYGNTGWGYSGGVYFWGGVDYNIVERVKISNVSRAIMFFDYPNDSEDGTPDTRIGKGNIVRNIEVNNVGYGLYFAGHTYATPISTLEETTIVNSTFNNMQELIDVNGNSVTITNFELRNNIFVDVSSWDSNLPTGAGNYGAVDVSGISFHNNNFYNVKGFYNGVENWYPAGNGNTNVDPKFVSQNDFHLTPETPVQITEGGQSHPFVNYDIEGKYRGEINSMGAYQFGDSTTGSVYANAGEDSSICVGDEIELNATGNGDFLWNTGETTASITVSPNETTTYTVTVTKDDNSASDEVIVTVNAAPSVSLGDDIDSCPDNEVTLTAEGNGEFVWNTGYIGPSLTVSPSETTTYTVTATVECGSEDLSVTDTIVININSELLVDAGEDVITCQGTEVVLTASGDGEYLWSTGETTKSITVNPSETTTFTVTLTEDACTSSDDVTVTIMEQPEVTLGDDKTICYGSEISLSAEGNGDFLWSTGETTSSIDVNPLETTEYIVTASVSCGAEVLSVSDTIVVNVTPELTLNVSDDLAFCAPQEVTLNADSNGDVVWSTGETTNTITVNPTSTTTYTVSSTLGDCTIEDEVTVTISEQPTIDLGDDVTLCSGNEITLTAQGNGAFLWSTGSAENEITVSPTETTEYIVTSSIDCGTEVLSVSDTIIVNVVPGVTLSVSDDISICAGTEIILTADGNAEFLWNTGETSASITVNPTETTTYSVTSGSGDCALTEEVIVTVEEVPEVNLGDDLSICYGEQITLTAEGVGEFLWSTGETTTSITVSPNETTTYSVSATTNCGGNNVSVSDDIIVNVSENITLSVSDDMVICLGSEVTLIAQGNGNFSWSTGETTASITVSPTKTTTYTVTSGSGSCSIAKEVTVTVEQVTALDLGEDLDICYGDFVELEAQGTGTFLWSNGATTKSIRVNPLETTIYSVSLTPSCGGTEISDEIVVNVGPQMSVFAGVNKTICYGESVVLTATGSGNFTWSTGETGPSITVSPTTETQYYVRSTINGCSVSDDVFVTVEAAPSVALGEDITICSGEVVTLIAEGVGNYLWSTGDETSSIDVSPTETTTYSITSSSHCSIDATDEITVYVNNAVNADAGTDISIEPGEVATLTASGGSSYLWNTGETTATISVQPNVTTEYSVEVSNNEGSCNGTDEVTVTVEDIPLTINDGKDITICKDDELVLQAYGSDNYLWDTGETGTTITVNPVVTTRYTVSAQKNGVLETVEILVIVEDCSANKKEEFNLYPNPTTGIVNISLPSQKEEVKIDVVSINGKLVLSKKIKGDKNGVFTQINLSRFAKGVYLLKMSSENYSQTKKVLVI
ncbi:T9SS type A sorting domain-containing protein [Aureibaculum conchae]|uniref:T9SS type A sorting domain-containing protein n=1 Tax=Aureibaculum sp. 2308TA14-22 TaxID=3108392 RepID=UPI0033917BAB